MLARDYITETEGMGDAVIRFLREHLTEARTDDWADDLAGLIPAKIGPFPVPKFVIREVVDSMLPEKMLMIVEWSLRRLGLMGPEPVTPSDPFPGN